MSAKPDSQVDHVQELRESISRHIRYTLGRDGHDLTAADYFIPVSLALRDRLIDRMLETEQRYQQAGAKRLYYLSMEFLMGRWLGDNLVNMKMEDYCREVLAEMGVNLDDVLETEPDAGLGNGGLGRLAACFLESLATLGMPGYGYGIDYEYGMFKQEIHNGYQKEKPDQWKSAGTPFQLPRPQEAVLVPLYGRVEESSALKDKDGKPLSIWVDWKLVVGVPHDMPVAGYGGETVNFLRLFSARSSEDFDIEIFNRGDYLRAIEQKIESENISRVLYPSDSVLSGKELRLVQEYFLVACSLRDIVRQYLARHTSFDEFPDQAAIQMNDTHPSLAVAELMRLLVDEQSLEWGHAWEITVRTLGYTNHTLLPEALEKWPLPLMERVLPRHLQIIYRINAEFLQDVTSNYVANDQQVQRMSIIEEGPEKQVRMAQLAIIGSHAVNGVSELHTKLLTTTLVPDFAQLWPERFTNKTNGVAPRRWLLKANPGLAKLLTRTLGDTWITDLEQLRRLEPLATEREFQLEFLSVKQRAKQRLTEVIQKTTGIAVDSTSLFDVQVKRIHEYKRQLLFVMRVIHDYLRIVEDGHELPVARTCIFAGKAAPGYWAAKQIIKLINNVAHVVNHDPRVRDRLKVAFVPDYRVSMAEVIIPAADLSEQISTAGMEASGTGNMKLQMNGALTIGTLDGANIEIREEVGEENFYLFGLLSADIQRMKTENSYKPRERYESDPSLKRVLDAIGSDLFCKDEPRLFRWIVESILDQGDRYFHLADLPSYLEAGERAERDFLHSPEWARKAILNVARSGKFSSDRTIREYSRDIWKIERVIGRSVGSV
ncbi:MAG: glycogen/starch/alpha-glucan phosphorylase [Acidobacteriales bacterium]|nr:glycogen/starch/alpha-glucan phosphorylase [Terriglobales bacterium]